MQDNSQRQLSDIVGNRLPEFIRVDHPTLVAFLEAYYEWLQLTDRSGKILSPMVVPDVIDIDHTLDQFIAQFKKEYLHNFPEQLAISKATGQPVDVRKLAKHIKSFYRAKGTEKSYEFLFRILYDVGVEFYYPSRDILRVSDGKWNEKISLKVTNVLGNRIYEALGRIVYQRNTSGEIVSSARVIDVSVYQEGIYDVAELTLTGKNGDFAVGSLGILFDVGEETLQEIRVYSVVSSITITSSGSNYAVGDEVILTTAAGDVGIRAKGSVSLVSSTGAIRKIKMDSFGINYVTAPTVTVNSVAGSGFVGTANVGTLCTAEGYYINNDGRLSTNKVLQDNHYYQEYSYVLKTEVVVDKYREIIRRLVHPAGTAMFGQVLIKRCSRENLSNSTALIRYEVPIIGHYAPYTFQTYDNLQDWFKCVTDAGGITAVGYSPSAHNSLITGIGNRNGLIGNPITNRIAFPCTSNTTHGFEYTAIPSDGLPTLAVPLEAIASSGGGGTDTLDGVLGLRGYQNADPFWIIYEHPNRKILEPVIAQVWREQLTDFLQWPERCSVTGGDLSTTWADEFDDDPTLEKKYAFVQYNTNSEFRKITARSFFEMPIGTAYDCRYDGDIEISRPVITITSPSNGMPLPASFNVNIANVANNTIIPIQERMESIEIRMNNSILSQEFIEQLSVTKENQTISFVNVSPLITYSGIYRFDFIPLTKQGRRCTTISPTTVEVIY